MPRERRLFRLLAPPQGAAASRLQDVGTLNRHDGAAGLAAMRFGCLDQSASDSSAAD
jgi:hypothetical protein